MRQPVWRAQEKTTRPSLQQGILDRVVSILGILENAQGNPSQKGQLLAGHILKLLFGYSREKGHQGLAHACLFSYYDVM
ncbi:MAG: hypothetical protein MJ202_11670 [Lentisphaeria bacterium]|nr:hypothetical protein [Lentisphaeria bacterium]